MIFDILVSSMKVVFVEIGGGFGGKISVYLELLVLVLLKKIGKLVKMVMICGEVLCVTGLISGLYIKVKMGVDKEGKIIVVEVWMVYEVGGFFGVPVGVGCMIVLVLYDLENF